jgi:hypothetical protein
LGRSNEGSKDEKGGRMEINVKYSGTITSSGDYENFIFKVFQKNEKELIVRISGSLLKDLDENKINPIGIAAKAIEYHFLGLVPADHYVKNQSNFDLKVDNYWYPGKPNEYQVIQNPMNFIIEIPKKKIGFELN